MLRDVKNKPQAIIMGVVTLVFVGGFVWFSTAQFTQSSFRSDLNSRGIEVPVDGKSFFEQELRRVNPNTGQFNYYDDDQVLFNFRLPDGTSASAEQPIAEDRYDDLGLIGGLTAIYLDGEPEDAELLQDGEFVANAVPYWIFAVLAGLFALGSGASAYTSSRPPASATRTT